MLFRSEWAYDRLPASDAVSHGLAHPADISVYAVPMDRRATGPEKHPILLSYLDVVVQGYLDVFGRTGVEAFFATTDGWDIEVLNDRKAPRYPRAQPLCDALQALTDQHMQSIGVRVVQSATH